MKRLAGLALILSFAAAPAAAAPLKVVAAENFYADLARQIGGPDVEVVGILNNPDQDPHLFEVTPAIVRQVAAAQILIMNGADYDPWMEKLEAASRRPGRLVVDVAALTAHKAGDNPHLWYDPKAMPRVAIGLAATFEKADRAHFRDYQARLKTTLAELDRITERVAQMRDKWAGTPVTATEPVFGPMADAIGLTMRNKDFQRATMNDTEPAARDIAAFEDDLKQRKVKVLLYNKQVVGKMTTRLIDIARQAKVPVVAVTETQPADMSYVDWMLSQLDSLDKALREPNS